MKDIIKKTIRFISSRALYFFIGAFFSIAVVIVYAALPIVGPGDALTSAKWNEMVNEINEMGSVGMIAMFDQNCPAGWTRFSDLDNRFPIGGNLYGAIGGTNSHTHTITTRSFVTSTVVANTKLPGMQAIGNTVLLPPYLTVVWCKKD